MSNPKPKLALRWGHLGHLMNFRITLEVDGIEIAHTPFYPGDKYFKRKVRVLKKALGVTGRIPHVGKWRAR